MVSMIQAIDIPPSLREIPQPPGKLYLEGILPDPSVHTYIAVVGSRRYSSYGREACESIIAGLAGHPIVIVSGLALGIDAIAHRAAITAGLPTIAVPGSGLDRSVLYPATNRELAQEILSHGGGLLSEYEPKMRASIFTFPQRNRIMAGLSSGVLIIEAAAKSGTLITARLALEYNRNVYAVPGSIFSPSAAGPNSLLRHGATPVTSSHDLLSELGFEHPHGYGPDPTELSAAERRIYDALVTPMGRDELIRILGISTHEASALLVMLEMKGVIRESLGEIRRTQY